MKRNKVKAVKITPKLKIERVIYDSETGIVKFVDLYDKTLDKAYFCKVTGSH